MLQNCNQVIVVIVTESPRYLAGNVSIMVATRKAFRRVKIGPLRLVSKGRLSMARWIRENLTGLAEAWAAPYTSVFFRRMMAEGKSASCQLCLYRNEKGNCVQFCAHSFGA